jgi:hypothetical protein
VTIGEWVSPMIMSTSVDSPKIVDIPFAQRALPGFITVWKVMKNTEKHSGAASSGQYDLTVNPSYSIHVWACLCFPQAAGSTLSGSAANQILTSPFNFGKEDTLASMHSGCWDTCTWLIQLLDCCVCDLSSLVFRRVSCWRCHG